MSCVARLVCDLLLGAIPSSRTTPDRAAERCSTRRPDLPGSAGPHRRAAIADACPGRRRRPLPGLQGVRHELERAGPDVSKLRCARRRERAGPRAVRYDRPRKPSPPAINPVHHERSTPGEPDLGERPNGHHRRTLRARRLHARTTEPPASRHLRARFLRRLADGQRGAVARTHRGIGGARRRSADAPGALASASGWPVAMQQRAGPEQRTRQPVPLP